MMRVDGLFVGIVRADGLRLIRSLEGLLAGILVDGGGMMEAHICWVVFEESNEGAVEMGLGV